MTPMPSHVAAVHAAATIGATMGAQMFACRLPVILHRARAVLMPEIHEQVLLIVAADLIGAMSGVPAMADATAVPIGAVSDAVALAAPVVMMAATHVAAPSAPAAMMPMLSHVAAVRAVVMIGTPHRAAVHLAVGAATGKTRWMHHVPAAALRWMTTRALAAACSTHSQAGSLLA